MKDWPHAPARRDIAPGTYFVTAGTYEKALFFHDAPRLDLLHQLLLETCSEFSWSLQCWAVFANHYHFVASCAEEDAAIRPLIAKVHACSSRELNRMDETPGRKVWYNFRDTRLTNQRSYFSRLAYVYRNPVKHKLAAAPEMYKWCSANWFRDNSDQAFFRTVMSFPTDRVNVYDEY